MQEIIIGSRWKASALTMGSLVFVAAGFFMIFHGGGPVSVLVIGLFALCAAIGLVSALRPARLVIQDDGFTLLRRRGAEKVAWQDIHEIFVWRHKSSEMVAWRYNPNKRTGFIKSLLKKIIDVDGSLPGMWPMSHSQLASRLNEHLRFYNQTQRDRRPP